MAADLVAESIADSNLLLTFHFRRLYHPPVDMLDFNLFGIPMVGADICGFLGHVNVELCARWQSLGAFYPFSRNHNEDRTPDQDPPVMGEVVVAATLYSLRIRYSLLPLLYTEFYKASQTGQPVVRSVFLEHPHDTEAEFVDTQFLWGHSVMIAPVVDPGVRHLNAYFPAGHWYLYDTYELLSDIPASSITGQRVFMEVPLTEIVVAIRGGSILATQQPEVTTKATRAHPFRLLVALSDELTASGDLYWDEGESIDPVLNGDYNYVKFDFKNVSFRVIRQKCRVVFRNIDPISFHSGRFDHKNRIGWIRQTAAGRQCGDFGSQAGAHSGLVQWRLRTVQVRRGHPSAQCDRTVGQSDPIIPSLLVLRAADECQILTGNTGIPNLNVMNSFFKEKFRLSSRLYYKEIITIIHSSIVIHTHTRTNTHITH